MKLPLVVSAISIGVAFYYWKTQDSTEPVSHLEHIQTPNVVPDPVLKKTAESDLAQKPTQEVPFVISSLVRKCVEDLNKIQTGEIHGQSLEAYRQEIVRRTRDIRKHLQRQKLHDRASIRTVVMQTLGDMGYAPAQAKLMTEAIINPKDWEYRWIEPPKAGY